MNKYLKIIFALFVVLIICYFFLNTVKPDEDPSRAMVESYKSECREDIKAGRDLFKRLETYSGPKNVETILAPLNDLAIILGSSSSKAVLYQCVHPNAEIRDIAVSQEKEIIKLATDIALSVPIYHACSAVDVSDREAVTQRFLEHTLRDFRRSGVDKSEETRKRIRELKDELVVLGQEFSRNILEDVRSITLNSVNDLAGLPSDYIDAHKPDGNGKIHINTDYPDFIPFSRYAQNDQSRFELYKHFRNRGYPQNKAVLKNILMKRYELARLLGYKNYAAYVTETKMIKSESNIRDFIYKISEIATTRAEKEYQILLERLRKTDPKATKIGDWQKTYFQELVKQKRYNIDSKEIRKYFQFGNVRNGIFDLTTTLYDVTFRPWKTEIWYESVEAYEMLNKGRVIGRFFLDLHPRENKYKHAAHFDLKSGVTGRQIPTSVLVCNFPGEENESALMEHSQVVTFFHEFGHMLHHFFAGNQQWVKFSGIATEFDFIEAPLQMLEEWVWDTTTLQIFAVNKEGQTIPPELVEKMVEAKEFGIGLDTKHQMFYAAMSLDFYDCDPNDLDLDATMSALQNRYSPFEYVPATHMYANFGHLDGYSAMYFTYMWSKVISKDLFSRFKQEGMLNPKIAGEYRKAVLAVGGSKDAVDLIRDFLGRPYSFEPFAVWLNDDESSK